MHEHFITKRTIESQLIVKTLNVDNLKKLLDQINMDVIRQDEIK